MKIEAFRGQYGRDTTQIHTKLPSITFSCLRAAKIYSSNTNCLKDTIVKSVILSAVIEINNPVINNIDDCFADFDILIQKLGSDFMWHIAKKHEDSIYNTCNWEDNYLKYNDILELKSTNPEELKNLYVDAYILLDDKEFVDYVKNLGYDGAIHKGNGQTKDDLEYRIFSEEQILNIKEIKNS